MIKINPASAGLERLLPGNMGVVDATKEKMREREQVS